MSKKKQDEKRQNARQKAYELKQAQKGDKIVKWIFGVLIVLAAAFAIWTSVVFS